MYSHRDSLALSQASIPLTLVHLADEAVEDVSQLHFLNEEWTLRWSILAWVGKGQ